MIRHRTPGFLCVCLVAATTACHAPGEQAKPAPARESSDARVRALADAYLAGYFDRNPDGVTLYGIPGRHHDQLPDNSLHALKAWEAKEDSWLAQVKQMDPATIDAAPLRGTYAIVREALEGSVGKRVCRDEVWNVSQMTGWQVNYKSSTSGAFTIASSRTAPCRSAFYTRRSGCGRPGTEDSSRRRRL